MLTERATKFLATLERRPRIPTEEVEAIIRASNTPCFTPWLEFHEKYAGYVENIREDWAIWGLAHENSVWLTPRTVEIEHDTDEQRWYAVCADCHPTYNYQLDDRGEFQGFPAESFDIHVERLALTWQFGEWRALKIDELRGPGFWEIFSTRISSHPVVEASDRFSRFYADDEYLVFQDAKAGILLNAWART